MHKSFFRIPEKKYTRAALGEEKRCSWAGAPARYTPVWCKLEKEGRFQAFFIGVS